MSNITVELGERSYPIYFDKQLLSQFDLFDQYIKTDNVVVVTNETVAPLYLKTLCSALEGYAVQVIELPDGEAYKNIASFESVNGQLLQWELGRDTTLIALGGGVIGDLTGFVAACYQRGIPFIQVPTTLLSQVDSSVGGKTAVNHELGKNMIGAFYQPKLVLIDTQTLDTLPPREFAAGMAEVIKYGVVYDDDFFQWLESHIDAIKAREDAALLYMVRRCCEIKAEVVRLDERESGIRAILNLGHTFGHAIEAQMGYGNWLHGEAVSVGIVIASKVAEEKGWLNSSESRRIETLLSQFDLPVSKPTQMTLDDFMTHMRRDKKTAKGQIRYVIPKRLGEAVVTAEVSDAILTKLIG
jgi:3-dehydroquinate synthase